jgi:hypothetical protein
MSLSTRVSGAWKDTLSLHTRVGGNWKPARDLWVRVSGVWKIVWSALTAVLDQPSYSGSTAQTSPGETATAQFSATVTATGYDLSYNWIVTGTYSTLIGQGTPNATVRLVDSTPQTQTGTIACQVTDGYGATETSASSTWSLTIQEPPL